MNLIEALNWRYAVRRFASDIIEEKKLAELLTATRLSATSYGLQPFRLITIKDINVRKELFPYAMGQDKVVNCSHLIVIAAQQDIGDTMIDRYVQSIAETRRQPIDDLRGLADHMKEVFARMNDLEKREWAHQQAYIALGTLLTSAAIMKVDSCPMTGFEKEGFDRVLGLDRLGLESSSICALGVRHADDNNAHLPKVRYDHDEMVITI